MVSTGFKIVIQNHKYASSVTYIIDIHHLVLDVYAQISICLIPKLDQYCEIYTFF